MAKDDYYKVLNVSKAASEGEIKKSYRKLAREFHPDVNPGDTAAEERFKEVQEAYDVLGDKEKRKKFDRFGHAAFDQGFDAGGRPGGGRQYQWPGGGAGFEGFDFGGFGGGGAGGQQDLGDLFGDLFGQSARGGRRRPSGPRRGGDLEYSLTVDFLQAARGGKTQISFQRDAECEICKGSGAQPGSSKQTCPQCGGSGMINVAQGPLNFSQPCNRCRGEGKVVSTPCSSCNGQGKARKSESLQVKIPAGVNDGSRIRLSGKGAPGSQRGPTGDLYIVVKVSKHQHFRREGDDIYLDVPISLTEAALGAKIVIPTVDGKTNLTIPGGIESGQKLRLTNKGADHLKGGGRGDQFVVIKIVPPKKLEGRAKELMEELAEIQVENPRADKEWEE